MEFNNDHYTVNSVALNDNTSTNQLTNSAFNQYSETFITLDEWYAMTMAATDIGWLEGMNEYLVYPIR